MSTDDASRRATEPAVHAASSAAVSALAASQQQFGANAANYATSEVHAKGASLGRMVELVDTNPEWRALDIATAAGHTAFAFAPHVAHVVASDATAEMLDVAAGVAADQGVTNASFEYADAHDLPFDDASFDLVTCRIAPHHFQDPATFVAEAARVLRPGGVFAVVDNLAPEDPETAVWCDDFERRRDHSHLRCLPISEWLAHIKAAGFRDTSVETMGKLMKFVPWADNMSVPDDVRQALLADLAGADDAVIEWLRPDLGAEPSFVLTEGIFVAHKR